MFSGCPSPIRGRDGHPGPEWVSRAQTPIRAVRGHPVRRISSAFAMDASWNKHLVTEASPLPHSTCTVCRGHFVFIFRLIARHRISQSARGDCLGLLATTLAYSALSWAVASCYLSSDFRYCPGDADEIVLTSAFVQPEVPQPVRCTVCLRYLYHRVQSGFRSLPGAATHYPITRGLHPKHSSTCEKLDTEVGHQHT